MIELFNEIINNYGARYTKIQKELFCEFTQNYLHNININCKIERERNNANIVIGDIDNAELVISAHYDTSNEYRYAFISGVTYNYFSSIKYFLSSYKSNATAKTKNNVYNYNDNTSGVYCILELAKLNNKRVAFVLFDKEENNLKGSRIFYKKHKSIFENKLLLNLDCVGCGDYLGIVYYTYFNEQYADMFLPYFKKSGNAFKIMPINNYATDAKIFKKALNISCYYKKNNDFVFYNIHTKKDNIIENKNLYRVVENLSDYIKEILPC